MSRINLCIQKNKVFHWYFLGCIVLSFCYCEQTSGIVNKVPPVISKGMMDCKEWDFEQNGIIELQGEWELYWNKLLTPDDFTKLKTSGCSSYIRVPSYWANTSLEKVYPGAGSATYRLRILHPPKNVQLGFYLYSVYSCYRLWIDGQLITAVGLPDTSKSAVVAKSLPLVVDFRFVRDTSEIVIQMSNYILDFGGLSDPPTIGTSREIHNNRRIYYVFQGLLMGAFLIMALYHCAFYLLRRKELTLLWFALVCFFGFLISLTADSLHVELFPHFTFAIDVIAYNISFYLSMMFLLLFAYSLFKGEFSKKVIVSGCAVSILFTVMGILLPFVAYSDQCLLVYTYLALVYIGYVVFVLLVASLRKKKDALVSLMSYFVILVCIANDLFGFSQNLYYVLTMNISIITLIFSNAFILAHRFAQASQASEAMNERLRKINRLKDDFLANTSHELRTPLAGIIGIAQVIIDDKQVVVSARHAQQLKLIVSSGKRLSNIVNDILDLSKLKNSDLKMNVKPVDIKNCVDIVLDFSFPAVGKKNVALKNSIDASIPLVNCDENRVQQILYNLIGNAIKFTHEGEIVISASVKEAMALISVADTGIGITQEHLGKLFIPYNQEERFVNTEYQGTGLGLSITKMLVELMGGTVYATSTINKGSVFTFTLPISKSSDSHVFFTPQESYQGDSVIEDQSTIKNTAIVSDAKNIFLKNKTVLLIDDEATNLYYIKNQLDQDGYTVFTAQDGITGLDLFNEHKPDVVLLDLMMPKMNGIEVCHKIREKYNISDLPIIILTAYGQTQDLSNALNVGANDYITKPCMKEELLARLNTHIQIVESINKLRQIQADVVRAGQLSSIGELAAGVAHEILTPIQTILLNAEIIIDSIQNNDSNGEYAHVISHEAKRISSIVNGLLTFAREDTQDKFPMSLRTVINKTLALIHAQIKKAGIKVVISIPDDFPELLLNCSKMQQVFMNLFSNSLYAIKHKESLKATNTGLITISAMPITNSPLLVSIVFEDNGIGIPQAIIHKIMNPFFTTKPTGIGTGLGLGICHGIIKEHGGDIAIQSIEREYTKIVIHLPINHDENQLKPDK